MRTAQVRRMGIILAVGLVNTALVAALVYVIGWVYFPFMLEVAADLVREYVVAPFYTPEYRGVISQ